MNRPKTLLRQLVTAAVLTLAATTAVACGTEEKPLTIDEMKDIFADKTLPGAASPWPNMAPTGDHSACAPLDTAMVDIPARSSSEPQLRLPKPQGWIRFTQLDSELIRYSLVNESLIAEQFAPNIVITIEPAPSGDARTVYEQAQQNLTRIAGAKDMSTEAVTVCGLPAEKLQFRTPSMGAPGPDQHVQALQILTTSGTQPYLVTATVQTKDPDNPTYQRDAGLLLTGLQVLAPTTNQ
ncbi:hypothetical protein [Mycolicibacterium austroafricanum]|uniref:hypothetical protein n=1 Tax=Mycolicibacterium austroafricanum TaxID=39687 RepID=UPI000688EA3D|nr:hypothetical protein [Mycolicibacterium austroafricanum]